MAGEVKASMARYFAQLKARKAARLELLGAMTKLELVNEALRLDAELTSTLRAIHKHKVGNSFDGGDDCDRRLWEQLNDGRFLTIDDKPDFS